MTLSIHDGTNDVLIDVNRDPATGTELVRYKAKLAVDADGCNGQHGLPIAYRVDNKGSERLSDIGYPRNPDEYSQGLICTPKTRNPIIFKRGGVEYYASRTALRMPGFSALDPEIGIDGEYFPYLVVPPKIIAATKGVVLGSHFTAKNIRNGKVSEGVVADVGPHNKIGEGSPALCRELGLSGNPLSGGTDDLIISIEIHVGTAAYIKETQFVLQHS